MSPFDQSNRTDDGIQNSNNNPNRPSNRVQKLSSIGGNLTIDELILSKTRIIVDDSAADVTGFSSFAKAYSIAATEIGRQIIIPDFCISMLHSNQTLIEQLIAMRVMLKWSGRDNYLDLFSSHANLAPFLVLAGNKEKGKEILLAAKGAKVWIRLAQITDNGTLRPLYLNDGTVASDRNHSQRPYGTVDSNRFKISSEFAHFQLQRIPCRPVRIGSVVIADNGTQYVLADAISHNEDSVTYRVQSGECFVKIFAPEKLTTLQKNKLSLMKSKEITHKGLCWPLNIVSDSSGTFIGYTMPTFRGTPLNLCIMQPGGIQRYFPEWKKDRLSRLAETIMEKIDYMHRHGILFGSIEPASIIIYDDNEVYFADTDHYQIEGFPCMKYSNAFCAPESLEKLGKVHLVTLDEERFAVAELAFALIMPGKTCYPSDNGSNVLENTRNMRFPFKWGSNKAYVDDRTKIGMWRFVWSHLSARLKENFYKTLMKSDIMYKPGHRRSAGDWQKMFSEYTRDLSPEKLFDNNSLLLFPPTFKRHSKDEEYIKCQCCGVEHPKFYFEESFLAQGYRYCRACLKKASDKGFTCQVCKREFIYTNKTKIIHQIHEENDGWAAQKYCKYCKRKKDRCSACGKVLEFYKLKDGYCPSCWSKQPYTTRICKEYGHPFIITNGEAEFLLSKGLQLPTRCPMHRKKRG